MQTGSRVVTRVALLPGELPGVLETIPAGARGRVECAYGTDGELWKVRIDGAGVVLFTAHELREVCGVTMHLAGKVYECSRDPHDATGMHDTGQDVMWMDKEKSE